MNLVRSKRNNPVAAYFSSRLANFRPGGGLSPELARPVAWRFMALAWAVEIFWLSTKSFGTGFSESLQTSLLDLLHISLSASTFAILHAISRKLAHLVEYGALSYLLYRSLGNYKRVYWRPKLAFWSVAATAAYSLTDEFHQLFVPGRGASLIDCCIDTIGAVISMLLVYAYFRAFSIIPKDYVQCSSGCGNGAGRS